MITELRLAKTCPPCSLFPPSCAGRRDGIKSSGFSEETTFEILTQGPGKQSATRSTPQTFTKKKEDQGSHPSRNYVKTQDQRKQYFFTQKFHRDLVTRKPAIQILD